MKKIFNEVSEKHLSVLAAAVSFICMGLLYFAVNKITSSSSNEPHFVVVDMQTLLHKQAQKLALDSSKKDENEELKQLRLSALAQKIKDGIEKYSFEKGVIVLNKAAVMGGKLTDITPQILESF